MARVTGLEPATSGVTGRRSNQLSYTRNIGHHKQVAGRRIYAAPRCPSTPRVIGWAKPANQGRHHALIFVNGADITLQLGGR